MCGASLRTGTIADRAIVPDPLRQEGGGRNRAFTSLQARPAKPEVQREPHPLPVRLGISVLFETCQPPVEVARLAPVQVGHDEVADALNLGARRCWGLLTVPVRNAPLDKRGHC